jgi:flavodoxin I
MPSDKSINRYHNGIIERYDMANDGLFDRLDDEKISRRTVLKAGVVAGIGLAGISAAGCTGPSATPSLTVTPLPIGSKTMVSVIYYSMTGNTKKMANAIAEVFGVQAVSVKETTGVPKDGMIFLGSGCYGGKPGGDMQKYIENNDFKGRKVALFGTSGGGIGKETEAMAESLKQKGAGVLGSYDRTGSTFLLLNSGHPDKNDLDGARTFAREMADKSG